MLIQLKGCLAEECEASEFLIDIKITAIKNVIAGDVRRNMITIDWNLQHHQCPRSFKCTLRWSGGCFECELIFVEMIKRVESYRSSGIEISELSPVRSFIHFHVFHHFRNKKM